MGDLKQYKTLAVGFVVVLAIIGLALASDKSGSKTKPSVASKSNQSVCGPYRKDAAIEINSEILQTEVAKNNSELEKGLGGRPCILPNQAMLFPFSKPATISMWMKGMKFPIDIVWIAPDHTVAGIEINVNPNTYPDKFINRDKPAQYVLEIKANRARELKLQLGSIISF